MRSHLVMPSGDELQLDCKANGKAPIIYTWYKDNEILLTRRVDSSLVTDRPQLILKDLVPSDSATYTCKVRNNMSSIHHNFTLTVQGLCTFFFLFHIYSIILSYKVSFLVPSASLWQRSSLPLHFFTFCYL